MVKTNVGVGETERCCASALRLFCLLWLLNIFYGSSVVVFLRLEEMILVVLAARTSKSTEIFILTLLLSALARARVYARACDFKSRGARRKIGLPPRTTV